MTLILIMLLVNKHGNYFLIFLTFVEAFEVHLFFTRLFVEDIADVDCA